MFAGRVLVDLYSFVYEPNFPSKRKKTTFSVGLIVTDKSNNVYLIERYLPYAMEDYICKKKKHLLQFYKFNTKKAIELGKILQKQNYDVDIDRFIQISQSNSSLFFEDQFDFPRGQCNSLTKEASKYASAFVLFKEYIRQNLHILLRNAWREWFEETGLRIHGWSFDNFMLTLSEIKAVLVEFTGGDGYTYTQLYFVINLDSQNVEFANCRREYKCILTNMNDAAKLLESQDACVSKTSFKTSVLHLLLTGFGYPKCNLTQILYYK